MQIIKTQSLTKYYGKARGIVELELSVGQGDFFGFIGPNGAGKSTAIRILLGLIKQSSGYAEVFGLDVRSHKTEILRDIGYMPSEAMFYDGMKVRDIIDLSARLRNTDCSAEAKSLCERLQLDTSKRVEELSLGNRKKVSIVCAMQHKPKLYILDEPTSGLDPLVQREFFSILEQRNRDGATVFLSSHVLSEIQRYCTYAAIIREGRIIACDSVDSLTRTNAKKVTVCGEIKLSELEGVRNIQPAHNGGVSFLYSGDFKKLLTLLSGSEIKDITIAEPDLEEIFIHYYTGDEKR